MRRREHGRLLREAVDCTGKRTRKAGKPGSLTRRAQQWLAARERLVLAWIARTRVRARASVGVRIHVRRRDRVGGAGAIIAPYWWEYESPFKRQLVLEAMLRRLFSVVPTLPTLPNAV